MFLTGFSGTGKTLLLVNALKTKVSYYQKLRKSIKISLCADVYSSEWARDMNSNKYGLQIIIEKYDCEPKKLFGSVSS